MSNYRWIEKIIPNAGHFHFGAAAVDPELREDRRDKVGDLLDVRSAGLLNRSEVDSTPLGKGALARGCPGSPKRRDESKRRGKH